MTARSTARLGTSLSVASLAVASGGLLLALARPPERIAAVTPSPCAFTSTHTVHPAVLPVGAELTVTLGLQAGCDVAQRPLRLVLVVDASEQMSGRSRDWLVVLLAELESAVRGLDLARQPRYRVGVVSFADRVSATRIHLANDPGAIASALHDIRIEPGTVCIQCGLRDGLRRARRMLEGDREDLGPGPVRDVILLASVGFDPVACDAVRSAASEVKPFGVLVTTACGGDACDHRCLAEAASEPALGLSGSDWGYLDLTLAQLAAAGGPFHPVGSVGIQDELAEGLRYTGGGEPNGGFGNLLAWTFRPWPADGITRTYHAQAVSAGRSNLSRRVAAEARLAAGPWLGVTHTIAFANPVIEVLPGPTIGASPSPRPTMVTPPTSPSPTSGPSPSVGIPSATSTPTPGRSATPWPTATITATPQPEPSATATPTREDWRLWLPSALAGACAAPRGPIDLALLIDVSGSMAVDDVGPLFQNRWAAAGAIAIQLVQHYVDEEADRVAVIPFAETAEVRARLGESQARVLSELHALPQWSGSRLDAAVAVAHAELERGALERPSVGRVVVLLTDGDLNQTELPALLACTTAARAAGVRLFAIGLGLDADAPDLAKVVGGEGRVFLTRDLPAIDLPAALGPVLHCAR